MVATDLVWESMSHRHVLHHFKAMQRRRPGSFSIASSETTSAVVDVGRGSIGRWCNEPTLNHLSVASVDLVGGASNTPKPNPQIC